MDGDQLEHAIRTPPTHRLPHAPISFLPNRIAAGNQRILPLPPRLPNFFLSALAPMLRSSAPISLRFAPRPPSSVSLLYCRAPLIHLFVFADTVDKRKLRCAIASEKFHMRSFSRLRLRANVSAIAFPLEMPRPLSEYTLFRPRKKLAIRWIRSSERLESTNPTWLCVISHHSTTTYSEHGLECSRLTRPRR